MQHRDFREADRLVTVYTKDYGKLTCVAKGTRKITSKLAGCLEPFIVSALMVARGKLIDTVTASEVVKNFRALKSDLCSVNVAQYIAAVVDSSVVTHQRDARIYQLLMRVFSELNVTCERNYIVIALYFAWRHLMYLGYQPELYECIRCNERLASEKNLFSFRRGGVVCSRCTALTMEGRVVSPDAIKVLRIIIEYDLQSLYKVKINHNVTNELIRLTDGFLSYTQERDLALRRFLPIA